MLLPGACALCGAACDDALCAACAARVPAVPEEPAPPPLARWHAGAPYEGEFGDWVRRFKYPRPGLGSLDPAAEAVVTWLARRAARGAAAAPGADAPCLVIPVPLHGGRLRRRSFSAAARLAAAVAREVAAPLGRGALLRLRDTPSQTGLSRAQRRRNVAGAFAAERALAGSVWLVDDVATTGSTLAEAARAARAAGAAQVVGVSAVRALR